MAGLFSSAAHLNSRIFFAFLLGFVIGRSSLAQPIHSPFDTPRQNITITQQPCISFEPVIRLNLQPYYRQGESRSIIDPERKSAYDDDIKVVRAFSSFIISQGNYYSTTRDPNAKACVIANLRRWAQAGALLDLRSTTARINTSRDITALAITYLQVGRARASGERDVIEPWLSNLAKNLRITFSDLEQKGDATSRNNQRYWAGLANVAVAAGAEDHVAYDWAVNSYRIGVCQIDMDGILPLEKKRGARAFGYHVHSAGPLVLMAEFFENNDYRAYDECDGALHRLVNRLYSVVFQLENRRYRGYRNFFVWYEFYRHRFHPPMNQSAIKFIQALFDPFLGGRLSIYTGRD